MRNLVVLGCLVGAAWATSCSGPGSPGSDEVGGTAQVSIEGATYGVRDVRFWIEVDDSAWFRIEGTPERDADRDCVPGLAGGLALYGDLPSDVRQPEDLVGRRLRVEFTGDGDDFNLCFAGMGRLAGAEEAWVTIDAVDGDRVDFTMSGTFQLFDEHGEGPVRSASSSGSARLQGTS